MCVSCSPADMLKTSISPKYAPTVLSRRSPSSCCIAGWKTLSALAGRHHTPLVEPEKPAECCSHLAFFADANLVVPGAQTNLGDTPAPGRTSRRSSSRGISCLLFALISLGAPQSTHIRHEPPVFFPRTTGAAQGDSDGLLCPFPQMSPDEPLALAQFCWVHAP